MPSLHPSFQKTIANPIYPKWIVILELVAILTMIGAWLVAWQYPDLGAIAKTVDKISWTIILVLIGHHWGFNYCLKRFALKYQRKD